ncbi:coproporphyrinogen dehydrogenase HemZ [Dethiobacter alkaliphilus]|uniref:coproporphyrinogen dehydrogenase HemZ n=1 Tax=Dethiobacter alkaliphilus TaxID=427926 RepID=UPI0009FC8AC9|nr:coproporphyrinogen dehydrogenase HemZ [Dethiobacter alkaliphilus]
MYNTGEVFSVTNKPWGRMVGVRPAKQLHTLLDKGFDYEAAFEYMHSKHGISKEKFDLLWRVAEVERPILSESSRPGLFSVYVGIPFCPTRCLYCSFPSHSLKELGKLRGQFVDTLLWEIEETAKMAAKYKLNPYTVYVGGGTPTALSPTDLKRVLSALREAFPGVLREFTVEAGRADTLTDEHLAVLSHHQVSRVSVNPQTMHGKTLELIGRCHSAEDVDRAARKVKQAKIPVLNMDLIVGLPGEDALMVRESMEQIMALAPENITLHVFSPKRASRFSEDRRQFTLPADAEVAAIHRMATEMLEKKYKPYYLYRQRDILGGQENIGFCLPGYECVYNIVMIEERHHIFGLGGGATSKIIRSDGTFMNLSNPKDVRIYIERVKDMVIGRQAELPG